MNKHGHAHPSFDSHAAVADAEQVGGFRGAALARELLQRLFERYPGKLTLRLWSGETLTVGSSPLRQGRPAPRQGRPVPREPDFSLVFRHPRAVYSAVLGRDPLRFAESYFRGDLDIEGDFFAALSIRDHLQALRLTGGEKLQAMFAALQLRRMNRSPPASAAPVSFGHKVKAHSKLENRAAVQFHYDVSNEFYALWLDRAMVYSCGYFESPQVDLETAQTAKLEHICRKLLLKPGERFLDVGCGWGALVVHAARHHGVRAHGITLSAKQLHAARELIARHGLEDRVTVELRDYRDLEGTAVYDKIASVGMFEHVGLKNLPVYFDSVHRLLADRGLFLNHGITHEEEGWSSSLSTDFINRYVFPDGQLDTVARVQGAMERSHFEIADVEALRPHYALTLRHWVTRLERHHAAALAHVTEATYRVWRLYMAASALEFEAGGIGIYQILASKRAPGAPALPLTRRHLYPGP